MSQQPHINHKMRAILIDWLVLVQIKFNLLPETLYLCVSIIDRFLDVSYLSSSLLLYIPPSPSLSLPPPPHNLYIPPSLPPSLPLLFLPPLSSFHSSLFLPTLTHYPLFSQSLPSIPPHHHHLSISFSSLSLPLTPSFSLHSFPPISFFYPPTLIHSLPPLPYCFRCSQCPRTSSSWWV